MIYPTELLWEWLKAENRHQRKQRRRGVVPAGPIRTRTPQPCTCRHAPKHHKKTGHCRPGCDCAAGANRP